MMGAWNAARQDKTKFNSMNGFGSQVSPNKIQEVFNKTQRTKIAAKESINVQLPAPFVRASAVF